MLPCLNLFLQLRPGQVRVLGNSPKAMDVGAALWLNSVSLDLWTGTTLRIMWPRLRARTWPCQTWVCRWQWSDRCPAWSFRRRVGTRTAGCGQWFPHSKCLLSCRTVLHELSQVPCRGASPVLAWGLSRAGKSTRNRNQSTLWSTCQALLIPQETGGYFQVWYLCGRCPVRACSSKPARAIWCNQQLVFLTIS